MKFNGMGKIKVFILKSETSEQNIGTAIPQMFFYTPDFYLADWQKKIRLRIC